MLRIAVALGLASAMVAVIALATSGPETPTFSEVRARWRPSEAELIDRNGDPIDELRIDSHGRRFAWTPLEQISPAVKVAVVTAEDRHFWSHRGVDLIALITSAMRAAVGERGRGASTITMQLASLIDPALSRRSAHKGMIGKLRQIFAA